jgi:hypothetical protein
MNGKLIICTVALGFVASTAWGQERASLRDQQLIEIAVANALMTTYNRPPPGWLAQARAAGRDTTGFLPIWATKDFVLEPTLYVGGINQVWDSTGEIKPNIPASVEVTPAHSPEHLSSLAGVLRIKTILSDSAAKCAFDIALPAQCRFADYEGFLQFSVAWVYAEGAQIMARVGTNQVGSGVGGGVTFCEVDRTKEREWVVKRCAMVVI